MLPVGKKGGQKQPTHGGKATNTGAHFQAQVTAFAYACALAHVRLPWFGTLARPPISVSSETLGPGDDIGLEFEDSSIVYEAQARHHMNGGAKLDAFVAQVRQSFGSSTPTPVALVVGRRSSAAVAEEFATDLDLLRDGREDNLGPEISRLLQDPANRPVLEQIYVVEADLDRDNSSTRLHGVDLLRQRLVDPAQAESAWDVLVADALNLAAREARRDATALNDLLQSKGYPLKELTDDALTRRLALVQELLEDGNEAVVLEQLRRVETEHGSSLTPATAARIELMRSVAQLRLRRFADALASAREAIRQDPTWGDAYAAAARSALETHQNDLARHYATQATELSPDSPRAWAAAVIVADRLGNPAVALPSQLRENWEVVAALTSAAIKRNNASEVISLTAPVLRNQPRRAITWLQHAQGMFMQALVADPKRRVGELEAVEAELTDLIRWAPSNNQSAGAYFLRYGVRQELGRVDEAQEDLRRAEDLNQNNLELVEKTALLRIKQRDFEGALSALSKLLVEQEPGLLALRAAVLATTGRADEARADLERAEIVAETGRAGDDALLQMARTALALKDFERSRRTFDKVSEPTRSGTDGLIVAAELDFSSGEYATAIDRYRQAADKSPDVRNDVLIRLAERLATLGDFQKALDVFDEVGLDDLPLDELEAYTQIASKVANYSAVQTAIERATAISDETPTWALGFAADLALRREDPAATARVIEELERRGAVSAHNRLVLVSVLIELDRVPDANAQLDQVFSATLEPEERLGAAQLLFALDRKTEAIEQAYLAFRGDRGNPAIQQKFAAMYFMSGGALAPASQSGVGTHVTLRRRDGRLREHAILDGPPIEPTLGELDLAGAEASGLVGLAVGDLVERRPGHWSSQQWTVEKIVPAAAHAAVQIVETFEDNFPGETPAFQSIPIVNDQGEVDFTRVVAALQEGEIGAGNLVEVYKGGGLAIESLAALVPAPVPAVLREPDLRPYAVEWPDSQNLALSLAAAKPRAVAVITRTALATAYRFELLDHLRSHYTVIAPTSLKVHLRAELANATEEVASGRKRMTLWAYQPHLIDIPPGDPSLIAARDEAEATLAWLEATARFEPRPLSALTASNARLEETRLKLGPSAFDALVLAETGVGVLYADDLVLRRQRTASGQSRVLSFSTISLLEALAIGGVISATDRDRLLVDLVLAGYSAVRPTVSLLAEGARRLSDIGREGLMTVYSTLAFSGLSLQDASDLGALAIQDVVTAKVQIVSIELVTELVIRAIASRSTLPVVAPLVARATQRHLALLSPHYQRSVDTVCARVAAEGVPVL